MTVLTVIPVQVPPICWIYYHCHGKYTLSLILLPAHSPAEQNDFPQLKYALLGGLGLLALIQRE